MGETGLVRFPPGSLDPRAQEFTPRTNVNNNLPLQPPLFAPPYPLYYPYAPPPPPPVLPLNDGGMVGYPPHPAYINTVAPSLPPPSLAPTRTLVLSSVPSDVSESLIRRELEVFGEVRGVQMERVCDGIVTVHFYDLRHAKRALKEIREQHMQQQSRLRDLYTGFMLNNFGREGENCFLAPPPPPPPPPARGLIAGCAVWAQFIIPPCNAVPVGHNQGTIVVFNLDPNVSTSSLREIFQAYGAVKELRETPLKKQQRFVEFFDVRDAAKALKEMNGKEIHGKQVVIEFSRPGGYGRKFYEASSTAKSPSTSNVVVYAPNNTSTSNVVVYAPNNHHSTISKYMPMQSSPPPPPPPPPMSHRFSGNRSPCNIPSQVLLTQTQLPSSKKSLNSSKGSHNENVNAMDSIEASIGSMSQVGFDGDGILEKNVDKPPKRTAKKNQSSHSTTTSKQQHKNRPWKGKQAKKLDTRFLINEDALVESNCSDSRTTVMIKNIPNKYSQKLLLNMLDNHCIHCNEQLPDGDDQPLSSYDFVYLPIDFNNKCNVGYGFVNMTSPQATWRLYKAFHHQHWEVFNSKKICEVTYARVQGLEALKEHFKNSKFPCEMDHYLPVVFSPPRDGWQLTEPLPIVGNKHQQKPVILGLSQIEESATDDHEMDGGDRLRNSNLDTDHEEENLNSCIRNSNSDGSSINSQNGGEVGDDDSRK